MTNSVMLAVARVQRIVNGHRVDNHPLRFRFENGTRVVDLDLEPHMIHLSAATGFFRRSRIEQLSLRFGEASPWSEDADFVVRYLAPESHPLVGFVAESVYLYHSDSEGSLTQTAWMRPRKYTSPFTDYYLKWLEHRDVPRWLEYSVLYELSTYMDADRLPAHPSQQMPSEIRAQSAALIVEVARRVSGDAINSYAVTPMGLDRRMMLLGCETDGLLSDTVIRHRYRPWEGAAKYSFFFSGDAVPSRWYSGTSEVHPICLKRVDHVLFDRVLASEMIAWFSPVSVDRVQIDGKVLRSTRYAGPPRLPTRPSNPGTGGGSTQVAEERRGEGTNTGVGRGLIAGELARVARGIDRVVVRPAHKASRALRRGLSAGPPCSGDSPMISEPPLSLYLDGRSEQGASTGAAGELHRSAVELGLPGRHHAPNDDGKLSEWWVQADTLIVSSPSHEPVAGLMRRFGVASDQRLVILSDGTLPTGCWRQLNPLRVSLLLTTDPDEWARLVADGSSFVVTSYEIRLVVPSGMCTPCRLRASEGVPTGEGWRCPVPITSPASHIMSSREGCHCPWAHILSLGATEVRTCADPDRQGGTEGI